MFGKASVPTILLKKLSFAFCKRYAKKEALVGFLFMAG